MDNEIRSILSERDLEYYEDRLDKLSCENKHSKIMDVTAKQSLLGHHLTSCKGKLVKVEICGGGCMQAKSGLLLDVGADFITLKMGSCPITTAIPITNIHSITFIHNNDRRQINKY